MNADDIWLFKEAVEEGLCKLPDMVSGGIQSMNIYAKVAK